MLVFCSNGSYAVMIFMRKVSLYKSKEHASFQAQIWVLDVCFCEINFNSFAKLKKKLHGTVKGSTITHFP